MSPNNPNPDALASNPTELDSFLSLLLEPSPTLHNKLVPAVQAELQASSPTTYSQVIDVCDEVAKGWSFEDKEGLISGHPLIGEVSGLSSLSSKEQGNSKRTPDVVLQRLAHLNKLYTKIYPSLPYITFVAGRPRSAIVTEIEEHLGLQATPTPLPDNFATVDEPSVESAEVRSKIKERGSEEWVKELDRAVGDVWRIAKARLQGMGCSDNQERYKGCMI